MKYEVIIWLLLGLWANIVFFNTTIRLDMVEFKLTYTESINKFFKNCDYILIVIAIVVVCMMGLFGLLMALLFKHVSDNDNFKEED